jgi:chromate transporter
MSGNDPQAVPHAAPAPRGSALEVLRVFLKLGLTSFGGPVAHLGYFRTEFVQRRRWLDERSFTDLVALCQFLPGPASSQVGIALGLRRAGWLGSLAAWAGFTLPSAIALVLFAAGVTHWADLARSGAVSGLTVAAVAVVAHAVFAMARTLCRGALQAAIAVGAALLVLALPTAQGQLGAIVLGGLLAHLALKTQPPPPAEAVDCGVSKTTGAVLLAAFAGLLAVLWALNAVTSWRAAAAMAAFYQSGALVFGGGHVVLPLLEARVVAPGWVSHDAFLAGYGAAQAVPGPLFTFAAYLGAVMPAPFGGWSGGAACLLALFLPAYLLVAGALPFWDHLRRRDGIQRALAGINAAVVGVLGAALVDPVATGAIHAPRDLLLALAAFGVLLWGRVSPVLVVAGCALGGWWFSR